MHPVGELRAIVITTVAGSIGMLVGGLTALALNAGVGMATLPFGTPAPSVLPIVLGVAGLVLGPAIALRTAGFHLAEVTAGLAGVWALLLLVSVGPLLQAVGPSWFPFGLVLAALIIARTIAGPFVPYIVAKPTAVATASR